jgi:hypothetical protein
MERRSIRRQGLGVLLAGILLGGASFVAVPHTWAQSGETAGESEAATAYMLGPAASELTADGVCVAAGAANAFATCDSEMPGADPLGVDLPPTSSSFGDDGPFSGGE